MKKQAEASFRDKCRFVAGFRYELFYSLNSLLDPASRIHARWRASSLRALGGEGDRLLLELGRSWEIWPVMASLLPGPVSDPTIEELLERLRKLPISSFRERILRGMIHADEALEPLLHKGASLKTALSKAPASKREWLSHIGLYPYDPGSPQVIALEKLLSDPERFRKTALRILDIYWRNVFRKTWEGILPRLRRSLEERERLFHSCSFAEFSRQALLRIEVDEARGEIRAIRGGYRLRFEEVGACVFLPSAFNDRRFWSAFEEPGDGTSAYFPLFDPSIGVESSGHPESPGNAEPALDPALIFRALGDATRFAIATILARSPSSSVELAKALSVSKPTISHHVHLLREAGLISEKLANGSVELSLRRSVLEKLSELTVSKLYDLETPMRLRRTRGG